MDSTSTHSKDDRRRPSSDARTSKHSFVSQTSTIEFKHTSFQRYSLQVKELCSILWPSTTMRHRLKRILDDRIINSLRGNRIMQSLLPLPQEFHIERLRGGGFNRVIGITVIHSTEESERVVLRVPRFFYSHIDREVAILRYVGMRTSIPVAEVKAFDLTRNNPLNQPYVIQSRIPGYDLQHSGPGLFSGLTHAQQCTVAKELGRILQTLQGATNPAPRRIEASDNDPQSFVVRPFEVNTNPFESSNPDLDDMSLASSPPAYETTLDFFLSQFERLKTAALKHHDELQWAYMDRFADVASQMKDLGILRDNQHYLCHLDLASAPRNIMVDIQTDSTLRISGILDWDDAVFAPKFVGCVPPFWLWTCASEEASDEKNANETPPGFEQQELKQIFEKAVGQEFCNYMYNPQYRLARKLFQWALHGLNSSWAMEEADDFLEEWSTMQIPGMPRIRPPLNDLEDDEASSEEELAQESEDF